MTRRRRKSEHKHGFLSGKIREACAALKYFKKKDLRNFDYGCFISEKQIDQIFRNLINSGEVKKDTGNKYRYAAKKKPRTYFDIIWHLIRSRRHFSTDEIEMLSEAKRGTVLEYLNCLKWHGYIRQAKKGHWQLINDPGPERPVNYASCVEMKKNRREKKKNAAKQRTE